MKLSMVDVYYIEGWGAKWEETLSFFNVKGFSRRLELKSPLNVFQCVHHLGRSLSMNS